MTPDQFFFPVGRYALAFYTEASILLYKSRGYWMYETGFSKINKGGIKSK